MGFEFQRFVVFGATQAVATRGFGLKQVDPACLVMKMVMIAMLPLVTLRVHVPK